MTVADVLIVGGGPAGHATARAYRDAGGEGEVVLLCAEPHPPYRRPPLTKHYLREPFAVEELYLRPPSWYEDHGVRLCIGRRAVRLDPVERVVTTDDGTAVAYRNCVLATGAEPAELPVPGGDDPTLRVMRRIEHADALRDAAASSAVVVGSGFIGCEAAASLALRGVEVSLATMEELPQAARLGPDAGRIIASWLEDLGVRLHLGSEVRGLAARSVELAGGAELGADAVLVAAGIRPNSGLAGAAGVVLDEGRVKVDQTMRSEAPGVWAVGDVALARNATAGRHLVVEHWGEALNHGEVAGRNLAGVEAVWDGVPGFWSTIGRRTLKYRAWGDGFDRAHLEGDDDAFTVRYGLRGRLVGVLTHNRDDDYEEAPERIAAGEPL